MHNRLRLLMAATAFLYIGPLLAGLAGFGWGLVPVFALIFIAWLMVLHPQNWPRNPDGWVHAQAWATLGTQGSVQLLLVAMLFGIGRGIGGTLGVAAPFPMVLPVLVSVLAIPLARIIWNPWRDTEPEHFLDAAVEKAAHAGNPVERSDLNLARRLIAPLADLPDYSEPEEVAQHLAAISDLAEAGHLRAALLECQHAGTASRAQTLALILHATDGPLIARVGGDGPTLALAVLPHDPDLIALFARRLAAALDADAELWGQCPVVDHLQDLAAELDNTAAEAPLRDLIDATMRAQPKDGLA